MKGNFKISLIDIDEEMLFCENISSRIWLRLERCYPNARTASNKEIFSFTTIV